MNIKKLRVALLLAVSGAALSGVRAENAAPPGAFCVVKIVRGDDVTFKPLDIKEVDAERDTDVKAAYIAQFNDFQTKSNAWYAKQHGPGETFKEVKPVKPKLEILKKDIQGRAAAEKKVADLLKLEKPAKK